MKKPKLTADQQIGKRIREARQSLGYTQEVLADAIGTKTAAISKKENGDDVVTAVQLAKLAKLLERDAMFFLQDVA